jgi:hypothetical protein
MEKELTLKEVYALLSEGKKVRKLDSHHYIHIVNNILRDCNGLRYNNSLSDDFWVEYKMSFSDFVENKSILTNLGFDGLTKALTTAKHLYKVICKRDNYVVLEDVDDFHPMILFKLEFGELKRDSEFFIEME